MLHNVEFASELIAKISAFNVDNFANFGPIFVKFSPISNWLIFFLSRQLLTLKNMERSNALANVK